MTALLRRLTGLACACLAFACSAKDGEKLTAVEQAAVSGAPQISADFPLGAPIFTHRSNAPIVAVVPGPGAYLVLADVEGTTFATHDLVATRVLANGVSADPHGVVIATAGPGQLWGGSTPAARVGDHWLVAYAGTVVPVGDDGRPGTPVTLPLVGYLADMSWDGQRALITTRGGEGIFVSASGTLLGDKFRIFPQASGTEGGSVALDGSNHLVSWVTSSSPATVNVTSVTSSGPTGQVATLYATTRATANAVSVGLTAGSRSVLAQYVASPPSCALGGRCTPAVPYYRILTSAPGGAITAGAEVELPTPPMSATFFGGNYLLWDRADVRFLDQNGMPTGTPGSYLAAVSNQYFEEIQIAGFGLVPSSDGSAFLSASGPLAGRVSSSFALLDDPLLKPLTFPAPQTTPVVTFDGTNYLTAWKDIGRQGIHAARVSKAGAVLDSNPRAVALGDFFEPFAASSTGGSLVGWLTNNPIGAAHVATTGAVTPLDLSALASPYVASADVGAGPSGYLLSLAIPVVVSDPPAMRAALLSTTGAFSAKLDFDAQQSRSSVTYDGQNYVVVWSDPNRDPREIRAARFTPSLSLVDSPPKVLFQYPADPTSLVEITSNGSESLVTWTQSGDTSIRVTRLSRALEVLDPGGIAITNDASGARGISTVWDGARYWIVWHGSAPFAAPHATVYGRRVSAAVVPLDATPFVVTTDLLNLATVPNRLVDMASDAEGSALVTYVQANTETHGNTVRGRMLSSLGQGGGGAGGTGGVAGLGGNGTGGVAGLGGSAGVGGVAGAAGQGGADAGAGGEGGNAGTSGDAGADQGGTAGNSGASGRGGSATGGAGEAGVAGEAGSGATSGASGSFGSGNGDDDDSGCSCSVPRSKSGFGAAWMLGIVIVCAARGRRSVHIFPLSVQEHGLQPSTSRPVVPSSQGRYFAQGTASAASTTVAVNHFQRKRRGAGSRKESR